MNKVSEKATTSENHKNQEVRMLNYTIRTGFVWFCTRTLLSSAFFSLTSSKMTVCITVHFSLVNGFKLLVMTD